MNCSLEVVSVTMSSVEVNFVALVLISQVQGARLVVPTPELGKICSNWESLHDLSHEFGYQEFRNPNNYMIVLRHRSQLISVIFTRDCCLSL